MRASASRSSRIENRAGELSVKASNHGSRLMGTCPAARRSDVIYCNPRTWHGYVGLPSHPINCALAAGASPQVPLSRPRTPAPRTPPHRIHHRPAHLQTWRLVVLATQTPLIPRKAPLWRGEGRAAPQRTWIEDFRFEVIS